MELESQDYSQDTLLLEHEMSIENNIPKNNKFLITFISNAMFVFLYVFIFLIGKTEFYRVRKTMWINYHEGINKHNL